MADARRASSRRRGRRTATHDDGLGTERDELASDGDAATHWVHDRAPGDAVDEAALRARVSSQRGEPALDLVTALALTRDRTGVDFTQAKARAGVARGHLLDVIVELPGGRADDGEHRAAEGLLELLLGHACRADWIGEVSVIPAPRGGLLNVVQARPDAARFFPLGELAETIESAVSGIQAGLSTFPLWALGGEQRWYLFELDPDPGSTDSPQADVVLASTFMPELLKCFLSGAPFASARFSRCGELFAYLEYENREADPRRALGKRRVLEDAIDAALVSERAGRVIGSGMGIVNSYVNFALDRVARGAEIVRRVAARVGATAPDAPGRLRFCDTALGG